MKQILRAFLFLLLFTATVNTAIADEKANVTKQGTVRGRIIDATKQTLPGASIYIEKLHTGVTQVLSEHGLIFAKLTSTFLLKQLISDSSDNRNSVRNNSCKGNVTNRLKNTHPIWQKRQHRPTNHLPKGTK